MGVTIIFYLCFIPIIWIAMRQGVRRVVTGLLGLNFGIVVRDAFVPPTAALFAKVALLMLVLSAVGLIVGSEVSERHRLTIDLMNKPISGSLYRIAPWGSLFLTGKARRAREFRFRETLPVRPARTRLD